MKLFSRTSQDSMADIASSVLNQLSSNQPLNSDQVVLRLMKSGRLSKVEPVAGYLLYSQFKGGLRALESGQGFQRLKESQPGKVFLGQLKNRLLCNFSPVTEIRAAKKLFKAGAIPSQVEQQQREILQSAEQRAAAIVQSAKTILTEVKQHQAASASVVSPRSINELEKACDGFTAHGMVAIAANDGTVFQVRQEDLCKYDDYLGAIASPQWQAGGARPPIRVGFLNKEELSLALEFRKGFMPKNIALAKYVANSIANTELNDYATKAVESLRRLVKANSSLRLRIELYSEGACTDWFKTNLASYIQEFCVDMHWLVHELAPSTLIETDRRQGVSLQCIQSHAEDLLPFLAGQAIKSLRLPKNQQQLLEMQKKPEQFFREQEQQASLVIVNELLTLIKDNKLLSHETDQTKLLVDLANLYQSYDLQTHENTSFFTSDNSPATLQQLIANGIEDYGLPGIHKMLNRLAEAMGDHISYYMNYLGD